MKFRLIAPLLLAALGLAAPAMSEELKVGSTPTGVPFTFLDVKDGQITGMMVDVVKAIGAKAGFTPDVQSVDWVSLIPALSSGRIDIISAAMSITDERKKVVDFSDPIFPYGEGLVMRKNDATEYTDTLKQTAGKTIGVQQGTKYLDDLKKLDGIGTIKVYENIADIMRDVQLGRIDVGFADQPIMAYQIGLGKFPDLKMSTSYKPQFVAPLGLAVAKDHPELLARINKGLAEIKADGELDQLIAKWNLN